MDTVNRSARTGNERRERQDRGPRAHLLLLLFTAPMKASSFAVLSSISPIKTTSAATFVFFSCLPTFTRAWSDSRKQMKREYQRKETEFRSARKRHLLLSINRAAHEDHNSLLALLVAPVLQGKLQKVPLSFLDRLRARGRKAHT